MGLQLELPRASSHRSSQGRCGCWWWPWWLLGTFRRWKRCRRCQRRGQWWCCGCLFGLQAWLLWCACWMRTALDILLAFSWCQSRELQKRMQAIVPCREEKSFWNSFLEPSLSFFSSDRFDFTFFFFFFFLVFYAFCVKTKLEENCRVEGVYICVLRVELMLWICVEKPVLVHG